MMKALLLALCFAVCLFAAHIDGVWKAEYTSPDGAQRQNTFHLKADGTKLTGKLVSGLGEAEIRDGTINGDDVSFTVLRNFGGNEVPFKYSGKVAGDELKLKVVVNDRTMDIVAKRQSS